MQLLFIILLILEVTVICAVYDGTFTSRTSATAEERARLSMLLKGSKTESYIKNIDNSPNIIGGNPANDTKYPWFGQTIITIFNPTAFDTIGQFICGASLIYSDIVMTAAHCLVNQLVANPGYSFTVDFYLGANQINGRDGTKYNVSSVVWPTSYNPSTLTNDIAFYKLNTSTSVNPASWNSNPSIPEVGEIGTAIGFGRISDNGQLARMLMEVDLPAISVAQCEKLYGIGFFGRFFVNFADSITCTYTPDKSTCLGDSGGPILTQNEVIYGVVSFGPTRGCSTGPSGFTRTSYFSDFIPKVICDYSSNPVLPCTGFEVDNSCGSMSPCTEFEVDDSCGLFGLSIFCPFTFGGIFGRLLRVIFGN